MAARVARLERGRQSGSPIAAAFGSFAAFEAYCDAEIASGRLDPLDGPVIVMCLRIWENDGTWGTWRRDRIWERSGPA